MSTMSALQSLFSGNGFPSSSYARQGNGGDQKYSTDDILDWGEAHIDPETGTALAVFVMDRCEHCIKLKKSLAEYGIDVDDENTHKDSIKFIKNTDLGDKVDFVTGFPSAIYIDEDGNTGKPHPKTPVLETILAAEIPRGSRGSQSSRASQASQGSQASQARRSRFPSESFHPASVRSSYQPPAPYNSLASNGSLGSPGSRRSAYSSPTLTSRSLANGGLGSRGRTLPSGSAFRAPRPSSVPYNAYGTVGNSGATTQDDLADILNRLASRRSAPSRIPERTLYSSPSMGRIGSRSPTSRSRSFAGFGGFNGNGNGGFSIPDFDISDLPQ